MKNHKSENQDQETVGGDAEDGEPFLTPMAAHRS